MTTTSTPPALLAVLDVIGHDPTARHPCRRRRSLPGEWPPEARWENVEDVHAVTVRLSRPLTRHEADELPSVWRKAPLSAIHRDGLALTRAHRRGSLEVVETDVVLIWAQATVDDAVRAVRDVHVVTLDAVLGQLSGDR